jgi:hypothetical protein
MKHALPAWLSLALLGPLGGCAAQATVTPPAVSANVDVNAQAAGTVDASGNVVGAVAPADGYQDTDPSALTDFHDALDAHGTWVDDPSYGTVWVPNASEVGATYAPYQTAGHWALDANDQYVWVSDYDWGWAPYHYGRWVEIDGRGWAWIPGRVYSGAWVTWGAAGDYATVGWAPMPPEFVWRGGVAVSYVYAGHPRWSYVGRGDVFAVNVGARIYTGPAAVSAGASVHPIGVSAGGGAGGHSGPPPSSLGLSGSQVPHVTAATSTGIAKAQSFGNPSTATSMGGHPPTMKPGNTLMPSGMKGGATTTASTGRSMTPTNTLMPGSMQGGATTTTGRSMTPTNTLMPGSMQGGATTTTATTTRSTTETPRATGQPGNTAVHETATTTTTTTQLNVPPKGRKKPTTEPAPAPKGGGGGGGGHSGGGQGGHGGTPHPQ